MPLGAQAYRMFNTEQLLVHVRMVSTVPHRNNQVIFVRTMGYYHIDRALLSVRH